MRTRRPSALVALLALVIGPLILDATAQGTPEGEMVLAWHVTIAPAWSLASRERVKSMAS